MILQSSKVLRPKMYGTSLTTSHMTRELHNRQSIVQKYWNQFSKVLGIVYVALKTNQSTFWPTA